MKTVVEKYIANHKKCVDILKAVEDVTNQIESFDESGQPQMYLGRLKRQRDVLLKEYNDEMKSFRPLESKEVPPIKLDDKLFDDHIEKYIGERTLNGIKHYLAIHKSITDPLISDVLEIELDEFVLVRGIGMLSAGELERFKQKVRT